MDRIIKEKALYSSGFIVLLGILAIWSNRDLCQIENFIGLIIFSGFISFLIANKNITLGFAFLYFSCNSIFRIIFSKESFTGFDLPAVVGFESLVSSSYIQFLTIVIAMIYCKFDLKKIFIYLGFVDALVLIAKVILGYQPWFLLNNTAIDCSLIGATLPLTMTSHFYMAPIFIIALIITKTSTGILALGAFLVSYLWIKNKCKFSTWMLSVPIVFALGLFTQGRDHFNKFVFLNGSGRYEIWQMAMEFWYKNINYWFGAGLGTYYMYGPYVQMIDAMNKGLDGIPGFFWMHNDYLQVIFETGVFGFWFLIIILYQSFMKLKDDAENFSGLFVLSTIGFIQMPLRWFLLSVLGCYYLKIALIPREECSR